MILLELLVFVMAVCALVPTIQFCVNLRRYKTPRFGDTAHERVAVLIPARDEERNIRACLESVLASQDIEIEVWVFDDDSADRTAQIVDEIARADSRVRLGHSTTLPRGWDGKQHACWEMAHATDASLMLFLDADVRLEPWAIARCVAGLRAQNASLLSGYPRLLARGWFEQTLLPMIHFMLLSFVPLKRMRKSTKPVYAAGCGQFLLVEREAYFASGGHAAIRETRNDGLRMPRLFREHGFRTDLVDLTRLAEVRPYKSARSVWEGLAKNATDGMAAPARIVPLTVLLLFGQVLPTFLGIVWIFKVASAIVNATAFDHLLSGLFISFTLAVACFASFLPRLLALERFKQPTASALLHPFGMLLFLAVQWYALVRKVIGKPVGWRSRQYARHSGDEIAEPDALA